jgi:phosphoesterase RecJ-like protein
MKTKILKGAGADSSGAGGMARFLLGDKRCEGFLIASHLNPEGDALGASLALAWALRKKGLKARVFNKDGVPEIYRFLPGQEEIISELPEGHEKLTLVLVDCGAPSRAGLDGVQFRETTVIDHHEADGQVGARLKWIEPDAPAAGLMIYSLLKEMGTALDADTALNLYTAIAVDTGTFRYSNTTAECLEAAAELIRKGVSPSYVAESLYETWSPGRLRLLGLALTGAEIEDGTAVMSITKEMFEETGTTLDDTENFTSFPRMLKGLKMAALLIDIGEGVVKGSLRSRGQIDVRRLAAAFGGGGHKNAAGFRIKGKSLEEVKKSLLAEAARLK